MVKARGGPRRRARRGGLPAPAAPLARRRGARRGAPRGEAGQRRARRLRGCGGGAHGRACVSLFPATRSLATRTRLPHSPPSPAGGPGAAAAARLLRQGPAARAGRRCVARACGTVVAARPLARRSAGESRARSRRAPARRRLATGACCRRRRWRGAAALRRARPRRRQRRSRRPGPCPPPPAATRRPDSRAGATRDKHTLQAGRAGQDKMQTNKQRNEVCGTGTLPKHYPGQLTELTSSRRIRRVQGAAVRSIDES